MSWTNTQRNEVISAITEELNRAEKNWNEVGVQLIKSDSAMDTIMALESLTPSNIPGHPFVSDGKPKIDEFIALVVDMRNSTDHLNCLISNQIITDGFQRVYYETSALLPAVAVATSFENGVVTEYLGDGALVLFKVNTSDRDESVRSASRAAKNCIGEMRALINTELEKRYNLPAMNLGVGISIGKAMVTLVGSPGNRHPKAIGVCVWEASKLSGGNNTIHVPTHMKTSWPSSKGGKISFQRSAIRGQDAYRLQYQ